MQKEQGEAQWIVSARRGDSNAFERALAPHLPMLLAYSRAICGDFHSAEDVVQETALIAYRNLNHLFPEADFAQWLRAIARRQALAASRKSRRLKPVIEEAIESAYEDPSPQALSAERQALSECLQLLSGRAGQIVRAHYFDGQQVAQLAEHLKMNANTIKTVLSRARTALHACMQRSFGAEAAR